MKKLTAIKASDIKGATFSEDLKDITVFRGPNYTGKTARLNAATLSLAGYLPGLPKTNAGVFSLASSNALSVSAVWDSGEEWTRNWTKKGKTVKATTDGEIADLPAVFLDAGVFFDAGPTARREMILRHCKGIEFDSVTLSKRIAEVRPEGHPGDVVKETLLGIEKDLDAAGLGKIDEVDHVATAIKLVDDILKEAKKAVDRHEGAARSLTELQSSAKASGKVGVQLQQLRSAHVDATIEEKRLAGVLDELTGLRLRLPGLKAVSSDEGFEALIAEKRAAAGFETGTPEEFTAEHARREERLKSLVQRAQDLAKDADRHDLAVSTLAEVAEALRMAEAVELPEETSEEALVALRAKAAQREASEENVYEARKLRDDLEADKRHITNEVQDLDRKINSLDEDLAGFASLTCCPTCGADGIDWKEKKTAEILAKRAEVAAAKEDTLERYANNMEKLDAAKVAVDEAEVARADAISATDKLADAENLKKARLRILDDREGCRKELAKIESIVEQTKESVEKKAEVEEEGETLAEIIDAGRELIVTFERVAKVEASGAEIEAEARKINDRIGEIVAKDGEQNSIEDAVEKAKQEIADLAVQIRDKEGEQKRAIAAKAELAAVERSVEERDKAKARVAVAADVKAILAEAQADFVDRTFTALTDRANLLCADVLPRKLETFQGDLGFWKGKTFVTIGTFSGAETAIAYAAVSIALAADADGPRIAIVDELGRLDTETKVRLGRRVRTLIDEDHLDQFIGADASDVDFSVEAGAISVSLVRE